jgi:hypothetical protein
VRASAQTGLAVVFALFSASAAAQRPTATIRVSVLDSLGHPIVGAEVVATRGLKDVVATGVTDGLGARVFTLPRSDDEHQLVVRRVGFRRGDYFFRPSLDTLPLVVRLRSTAAELPAVQVTAQQDLKRKRYHVDADDIAAATRLIRDGLDVVLKMRPDMADPPGQGFQRCGLFYIWINGKRVVYPPIDPALAIKTSMLRRGARMGASTQAGRPARVINQALIPVSVQSVLATIHPEHIEELNFIDCRDNTLELARAQGALFVVLKPGIAFEPGRGTYVVEAGGLARADSSYAAARRATSPGMETTPNAVRILGVFDEGSGEPIAGAQVVDVASGTYATTTQTGTVALSFLPAGVSTFLIRMSGYSDTKLEVSISPRDSMPITVSVRKR